MKYRKNVEWLEAEVKDEMLMMHAESGRFVSLNDTGTFLWEQIGEPKDIEGLAACLEREFEVDQAQARVDVERWIGEMRENDVIVEDSE